MPRARLLTYALALLFAALAIKGLADGIGWLICRVWLGE